MNVHLLEAAAWAGVISLDFTGCGPWMVSQPLVCGPLFGWLMGHTEFGVIIGGILQLLWMDVTPVGVGIPYDATATTILAVYWSSLQAQAALPPLVQALFIAVPFGFFFRWMDQGARRLNSRLIRFIDEAPDERLALALDFGILAGLAASWLRYALSYALSMWAGERLCRFLAALNAPSWMDRSLTLAGILLPVAGLGVALELFLSDEPERRWMSWRQLARSRDRRKSG